MELAPEDDLAHRLYSPSFFNMEYENSSLSVFDLVSGKSCVQLQRLRLDHR